MQATLQQENSSDAATLIFSSRCAAAATDSDTAVNGAGMKGRVLRSAKECYLLISGGCCAFAAVRPLSVAAVKDKYRLI
jgi:hypothetical protein